MKNKTHINSRLLNLVALSIIIALILSAFLNFSCVVGEKVGKTVIDSIQTVSNNNDKNNNKIQDNLDEELKTMNATDNLELFVTLTSRDEGVIKFAESYGAKIEEFYTIIDMVSLTAPVENITKIASYCTVDMVYKNREVRPCLDSSLPAMLGDKKTLQAAGFDVDGSGVTIAIIDSGISGLDSLKTLPDGKPKIIGWKDCIAGKSQAYDDSLHGTYMASIASAVGRTQSGTGVMLSPGVAPGSQLVIAKGLGESDRGATPLAEAVQWVLDNKDNFGGIDVVSMSVFVSADRLDGYDPFDVLTEKLVSAGMIVAVCAGNDGPGSKTITVPGTARTVITVGAVDDNYNIASFSSRGPTADGRVKPDLCADGVEVGIHSGMVGSSGTSEATPHVAGTAALLVQYHEKQLDKYNTPSAKTAMKLTPAIAKDILLKSASQPSKGGSYPNNNYGNGVLNIKNALTTLKNKNYLPMAKFVMDSTLSTGTPISFDASGSIDPNGDTLTYAWDFGDGTTGSGKTTTHTYSTAKNYTVTLTVKDSKNNANDFGASTSIVSQLTTIKKSLNIITGNTPPTAKISVNGEDIVKGSTLIFSRNEVINLDASKSSDTDGQVATVSWNMGDGTQKTGKTITHSYTADGRYDVVAKVTDDKGAETPFDFVASVANKLPIAKITVGNASIQKGGELKFSLHEIITLDASGSTDPDGQVATVSWAMGDGAQKSGKTTTHSYSAEGNYPVTVKLTDDKGGETTFTFTINIGNAPPVADIRIGGNAISDGQTVKDIAMGKETTYDASHSIDREGSIKSVTWDMGDGSAQKSGLSITHTYTGMNTYSIVVKLTDDANAVRTFSFKVEVSNAPPVITQVDPIVNVTKATKSAAFQFTAPQSSDPSGNIVSAVWDFGDGITSDEQNPSHKYDRSGTYTVTYTVTDDAGATTSVSTNVTVTKQPPVVRASNNVKANIRDDVVFDASRSYSPDGEIVSYLWSIEGNDYTETTIPYRFSERGDYTVTLTVTDDEGLTNTTTVSVNVANMLPAAVMGKIPETVNTGEAVEFKATSSFDFDGEIDKYAWNFGDGKTGTGKTTSHVYEKPGTYNAVLTIWDNDGETNTSSFMVNVQGVAGEAYAYAGGAAAACAVVAIIILLFYFKPSVFVAKREAPGLKSFQTPRQAGPPSPPTVQQSSYNTSYQPQQYQTQTRPPQPQYQPQQAMPASDQYSYPAQPSYPVQPSQYGTCPNCGGVVQIPPSTGRSITIQCPSCGAESTIE